MKIGFGLAMLYAKMGHRTGGTRVLHLTGVTWSGLAIGHSWR
jgi:hypothetical protein